MAGMKDLLGDTPYTEAYPNGPGFQRGSATSKAAAQSVRGKMGPVKTKIANFLFERGALGATYDEIVRQCQISTPTVCGRMVELVNDGIVKKSDRTRQTSSGRAAVIYKHASVADA